MRRRRAPWIRVSEGKFLGEISGEIFAGRCYNPSNGGREIEGKALKREIGRAHV